MRIRPLLPFAAIAALTVVTAGCGSGEAATPTAAVTTTKPAAAAGPDLSKATFVDQTGKDEVTVLARDNTFVAQYIEVAPGTTITFTNDGEQPHNVKPAEKGQFKLIDTADFSPGDSDTITLTEPGDYAYYCSLHGTPTKGMTGAIRVLE